MNRYDLPTPCYLVSEAALTRNLEILKGVSTRTGCKILLAQKAFSMFAVYPLIAKYLDGAASSGLYEARLAHEHMGKENHTFSPAFRADQFAEIAAISGHIVFNSLAQYEKFGAQALSAGVSCGLRVNPEHSTQDHAIYDPCAPGSRLGVRAEDPLPELPDGIEGLHFHTLCEQGADALSETLDAVIEKFEPWLKKVKWINFGGGHHITKPGYDISLLESCIRRMQRDYGLEVYLEPGEAVALNAGILITTVLDIAHNGPATLRPLNPARRLVSRTAPRPRNPAPRSILRTKCRAHPPRINPANNRRYTASRGCPAKSLIPTASRGRHASRAT